MKKFKPLKLVAAMLLTSTFIHPAAYAAQGKDTAVDFYAAKGQQYEAIIVKLKADSRVLPMNKNAEETIIFSTSGDKFPLKKYFPYKDAKNDKFGLNRYFTLPIPQAKLKDADYINTILKQLGKNHNIEIIYPSSKPVSLDIHLKKEGGSTKHFSHDYKNTLKNQLTYSNSKIPNLTNLQYYMLGSDEFHTSPSGQFQYLLGGIGAFNAHKKYKNSQGQGIKILSAEETHLWNTKHIDLPQDSFVNMGSDYQDINTRYHDTMSVGVMAAKDDDIGMTGIANQASFGFAYGVTLFVYFAAEELTAGDVIQLGVHLNKNHDLDLAQCKQNNCYVPVEYEPGWHDLISDFTDRGIHVVMAAGNGYLNLDNPIFGDKFNRKHDSGAIYAAAVCGETGRKASFTNYGTRIDSAGWGCHDIATTTSDNKNASHNYSKDTQYTTTASGTSIANPIVAGVVASISGYAKSRGITISPKEMRDLVTKTGTPFTHNDNVKNYIGTHPNLEKALSYIDQQLLGVEPLVVPYAGTWYVSDRAKFANKNGKHSSVYYNLKDETSGNKNIPRGAAILDSKWEGYNQNRITVNAILKDANGIETPQKLNLILARTTDCGSNYQINTGVSCGSATPTHSGFAVKVDENQKLIRGKYKTEFDVDVNGWHDPKIKGKIKVEIDFDTHQTQDMEKLSVRNVGEWRISNSAKFANKNGKHSSVYFNIQDEAGINGNLSVPKGSAITGSKWEGYNRNNITVWVKKLEDNSIHPLALTLARTTDCRGDYHINTGVTCDSATPTNSGFAVKVNEGQTLPNGTYKTEFWVDVKGWHDPTIKNLILVDIAFKI